MKILKHYFSFTLLLMMSLSVEAAINDTNICDIFPRVAQSHSKLAGSLTAYGDSRIIQTHNLDKTKPKSFTLRFGKSPNTHQNSCSAEPEKGIYFQCLTDAKLPAFELKLDKMPNNIQAWETIGAGKTLVLGKTGNSCRSEKYDPTKTGVCNFESVTLNGGTLELNDGTYWINYLTLASAGGGMPSINIKGKVKLYVKNATFNAAAKVENEGDPDDFIFIISDEGKLNSNSEITALIYAVKSLQLNGNTSINGAVSVGSLSMNTNAKIYGENQCLTIPDLLFEPSSGKNFTGKSIKVVVKTISSKGLPRHNVNGTLLVNVSSDERACISGSESGECLKISTPRNPVSLKFINGEATFWLKGLGTGDVSISTQLTTDGGEIIKKDSGIYTFLPKLELDPEKATSASCSDLKISVRAVDAAGLIQSSFNNPVTLSATGDGCLKLPSGDTCSKTQTMVLNNGIGHVFVRSDGIGQVDVEAKLEVGSLSSTANGSYFFRPEGFRFEPAAISLVTGKPQKLSLIATSGSCSVVKAYKGQKKLDIGVTKFISPSLRGPEVKITNAVNNSLNLNFVDGVAKSALEVQYDGAGEVEFTLTDSSWNPVTNAPFSEAELQAKAEGRTELFGVRLDQKMEGTAALTVRPYTYAICNVQTENGEDLNNLSGPFFAKAGEPFSAFLKPVGWNSGDADDVTNPVNLTGKNYCDRQRIPGYFSTLFSPDDKVVLKRAGIVSPSDGSAGSAWTLAQDPIRFVQHGNATGYSFEGLSWDEVGTVRIRTEGQYLGQKITPSYIPVGPFEPDHFEIFNSRINTASPSVNGSKAFSYMNQPFTGQFEIKAMTGGNNPQAVKNYHKLASGQVTFYITAVSEQGGDDLTKRISYSSPQKWIASPDGISVWKFDDANMSVKRSSDNSPDGPFNQLALGVKPSTTTAQIKNSDRVTNTDSEDLGAKWGETDIRYGRLRISDTAGNLSSDLSVPVYAEYYDGAQFVVNQDDNASKISIGASRQQEIYSDGKAPDKSSIVFDGTGTEKTLKNGAAAFVVKPEAENGEFYRRQFRLWQCLKSDTEQCKDGVINARSWLTFGGSNNSGNPSAIITLGTYRGNDRIIYQGEKNANVAR
ncbi:hypothetical protein CS022_18870 [Veronia nyctiphanis]|uniref:MSHA biogenesis protein MshQ n=1 Tax=Veronia nyctiphanis TaxID=1278244 RepID=A0A4Q0YM95_9GAMM|nr:DUF6701 domain-containing protein [Veronia nyctiphanis]RXJ71940.1 hypothetical protein CS022_18870 [Veronia nyctiphanis]